MLGPPAPMEGLLDHSLRNAITRMGGIDHAVRSPSHEPAKPPRHPVVVETYGSPEDQQFSGGVGIKS